MTTLTRTQAAIALVIENALRQGAATAEPALLVAIAADALPKEHLDRWKNAVALAKDAEAMRWLERFEADLSLFFVGVSA